jgi:hypothetical protein
MGIEICSCFVKNGMRAKGFVCAGFFWIFVIQKTTAHIWLKVKNKIIRKLDI